MKDFQGDENSSGKKQQGLIKNIPPILYVIIVLSVIFILYQMIGGALALISGRESLDKNIQIIRIILSFSQFMLIFAPTIFFARLQTSDLKKTFRLNNPDILILLLSVLGMIFVQPFLQGYMYFQEFALDNSPVFQNSIRQAKEFFDTIESDTLKIVKAFSAAEFIVVVFVICLTPAICEEFLFRGFVLSNLLAKTRAQVIIKPSSAIFLSGFMFAVYHFQPFNTVPLIILGFYLGFVVYYSNSIYTGISCHFINNFLSAYLLFVYGKEEIVPDLSGSEKVNYALLAGISLIVFTGILILIYKISMREKPKSYV